MAYNDLRRANARSYSQADEEGFTALAAKNEEENSSKNFSVFTEKIK